MFSRILSNKAGFYNDDDALKCTIEIRYMCNAIEQILKSEIPVKVYISMKKLIAFILLTIIFCINIAKAQSPNWLWAKSIPCGSTNDHGVGSVSTDLNGNVLIAGIFISPTISFGSITLTNADPSTRDIFIVKYDSIGNVIWAKNEGGASNVYCFDVTTDESENIFITGNFEGTSQTFGTTTLTNTGSGNLFIAKYDPNGNVLWAKTSSSAADHGNSLSVSCDAIGNAFISGVFTSPTISFGTTTLTNEGYSDAFIIKYDSNGNFVWAKSAGGTSDDISYDVSTDGNGNVFIAGNFRSANIAFGSINLTNQGSSDIFIAKYDSLGNLLRARASGGISVDDANGIATDMSGNVILTGAFLSPNITFGATILTNASAGLEDVFTVKYDSNGNVLWAKHAGGGGGNDDVGFGISADSNGNAFLIGYFESPSITFGTITLNNAYAGNAEIFIVKFDSNGNVLWAKSAGGTNDDYGYDITTSQSGNIYIIGWFQSSTITFGTTTLSVIDPSTDFIAKLDNPTIGIKELFENTFISIAPNPLINKSIITFGEVQKDALIKIIDILGNEISSISFSGKECEIDKGNLKAGVYSLRTIDDKKNVSNAKIIIQ